MTSGHGNVSGAGANNASAKPAANSRDAIVDALLRLAARRGFDETSITDIAREAAVSLADFRDAFPSKGAVLGAFLRRIDRKVLDNLSHAYDDEPSRERLYHVLAHRLDALEPVQRRRGQHFRLGGEGPTRGERFKPGNCQFHALHVGGG